MFLIERLARCNETFNILGWQGLKLKGNWVRFQTFWVTLILISRNFFNILIIRLVKIFTLSSFYLLLENRIPPGKCFPRIMCKTEFHTICGKCAFHQFIHSTVEIISHKVYGKHFPWFLWKTKCHRINGKQDSTVV